jgi:tight adherence protein B
MQSSIQLFVIVLAGTLVAGFFVILIKLWVSKYSPATRAYQKRLQSLVQVQDSKIGQTIYKAETRKKTALDDWLRQHVSLVNYLENLLVRAGSQHTATEFISLIAGLAAIILAFVLLLGDAGFVVALIISLGVAALPLIYLIKKEADRTRKFDEVFPEALDFLSRALRAGHGLTAAIGMLAEEFPGTVGQEFKVAFEEINFGLSFGQALSNMTERINSRDLNFFVIALLIQRETGGNLAELLSGLATTVRERMKIAGKVRTISAEGRLSGIVVGALPFVLVIIINLFNPDYISVLWTTPEGLQLVTFGLCLMALGGLWIWKVVQIKI